MLRVLELRDFAIVDELRLELRPGLTALTGETGAGKSILVDALSLLVGGRADVGLVRSGAPGALVQAELDEGGLTSASRRLVLEGRNHARLDGELVTVAELAERMGAELAVFAQHAAQELTGGPSQRQQLDRLLDEAGAAALSGHRAAWMRLREVEAELERIRDAGRERARRADVLRYQLEEIDRAAPRPGEREGLERDAERLRHAERIGEASAGALAWLEGSEDGGAVAKLASARRALAAGARFDPDLAALEGDLGEALSGAEAVAAELQGFLEGFDADPAALDRLQARLAQLDELERKYGDGIDAVLAYRAGAASELAELEGDDARRDALEEERERLEAELSRHGAALSRGRADAARRLERGVRPLLAELALPDARLEVEFAPSDRHAHGAERVRLLFGANPGEGLSPLSQIASGGELSRLMLALNLVTGSERPTLIFDEVDAGVGGRAARALGELLAALARDHQVLVVTHLPQVAAHAHAQFRVEKRNERGRTVARVTPLEGEARERELARMLSGSETDAALANARELLASARRGRGTTDRPTGASQLS